VRTLAPTTPEYVRTTAFLAELLADAGCAAAAAELDREVVGVVARIQAHPTLRVEWTPASEVFGVYRREVQRLRAAGDLLASYETCRAWFGMEAVHGELSEVLFPDVRDGLRARLARARAGIETGAADAAELRRAAILYGELEAWHGTPRAAADAFGAAAERDPTDVELRAAWARALEATGEWERALAVHTESRDALVEHFERTGKPLLAVRRLPANLRVQFGDSGRPDPLRLVPDDSPLVPQTEGEFQMMITMAYFTTFNRSGGANATAETVEILRIAYENGRFERAAEELRALELGNEQQGFFSHVGRNILEEVDARQKLPVLRVLHEANPFRGEPALTYAELLETAGAEREALDVLDGELSSGALAPADLRRCAERARELRERLAGQDG
jgi:hypothetical protein